MTELATYELDERIATITIDDGKVNAFSIPMLQAIHAAFDQAERDGAIVILTGRENYFSAGFDLKVFAGGDVAQVIEMLTLGATLAERILSFATPVITTCSGHTVAAGAFLPLAADLRIGTDGPFRVGLNEVKIGLTVPWFVIELARQRLHPAELNRSVISATMYNPSEAVTAGFFDRIVPSDELLPASLAAAAELAELNPAAHAATKLRVRGNSLKAIRSAIETELTPEGLGGTQAPA
jgi:enoyl-CoA hydratase